MTLCSRSSLVLALAAFGLAGCDDATTLTDVQATLADGVLTVTFAPSQGGQPAQPSGSAMADVIRGDEVLCSTEASAVDAESYTDSTARVEAPTDCEARGSDLQVRLHFTPTGGDEVVGAGALRVVVAAPAEEPAEERAPRAANVPPPSRPAGLDDWPCGRTMVQGTRVAPGEFTYEYDGRTECVIPPYFQVVGCPSVEHFRRPGQSNYDRTFTYDDAGRMVSASQSAPEGGSAQTFEVRYDGRGRYTQIIVEGAPGHLSPLVLERDGDVLASQEGDERQIHQLDERGRILSIERRTPRFTLREVWHWEGERVTSIEHQSANGTVFSTVTFDYEC